MMPRLRVLVTGEARWKARCVSRRSRRPRGCAASPHEIGAIRKACGDQFVILTPGIRPAGEAAGDQRRTMTPAEAVRAGADYIVVGRPITNAKSRREAALRIVDEMATSLPSAGG